jgi:hypothetical protein
MGCNQSRISCMGAAEVGEAGDEGAAQGEAEKGKSAS